MLFIYLSIGNTYIRCNGGVYIYVHRFVLMRFFFAFILKCCKGIFNTRSYLLSCKYKIDRKLNIRIVEQCNKLDHIRARFNGI